MQLVSQQKHAILWQDYKQNFIAKLATHKQQMQLQYLDFRWQICLQSTTVCVELRVDDVEQRRSMLKGHGSFE